MLFSVSFFAGKKKKMNALSVEGRTGRTCMSRDKLSFTLCDFPFDEKNGI